MKHESEMEYFFRGESGRGRKEESCSLYLRGITLALKIKLNKNVSVFIQLLLFFRGIKILTQLF